MIAGAPAGFPATHNYQKYQEVSVLNKPSPFIVTGKDSHDSRQAALALACSGRLVLMLLIVALSFVPANGQAEQVDEASARLVAGAKLRQLDGGGEFSLCAPLVFSGTDSEQPLFFIFELDPRGYVVVSADSGLPPVLAYSLTNSYGGGNLPGTNLPAILRVDLELRLRQLPGLAASTVNARTQQWQRLLGLLSGPAVERGPQQWPPAGTTSTGGWLESNWHQEAPYNNSCPLDPVTTARSIAGCPSVVIAQILNYLETTNDSHFDDSDDYYHSYDGRNYWIDNDHVAMDFPSFPELNIALDILADHYANQIPADDNDKAALTFACGVAAEQVYTSSVSGTFGVGQAYQAYQKLSFTDSELLSASDPDLYQRLAGNMKVAVPAHLAVLSSAGTGGHNVVVDGYNSDDYFHLNFGWGGSSNGWYLLPDQIPHGLTVIEGVIVDIVDVIIFSDGFESGDTSNWSN